jgi:hypothetical protein
MKTLTFGGDLLLTLLLHVGASASICAWLARSATFRKVLFTELRDSDQKLKLMLFVAPPLLFGVILRILGQPYRAADLMRDRLSACPRLCIMNGFPCPSPQPPASSAA